MPPLVTKAERALAAWLLHDVGALHGVAVRTARTAGGDLPKPSLLITALTIDLADDLPPVTGTYSIDIQLLLTWPHTVDDPDRRRHLHLLLGCLQSALSRPDDATAFLNDGIPSARPVGPIHLHDLELVSASTRASDSDSIHTLVARLTLNNTDA